MSLDRRMLMEKWAPVLNHDALPEIKDHYRKEVTAILLENQEREMRKQSEMLFENQANSTGGGAGLNGGISAISTSGSSTGGVAGYDPVLISLVRRAMPQLIAYDICGVQPMTQPTGLIFAMKSRYVDVNGNRGNEALFNEANTYYSGATGALGTQAALTGDWAGSTGSDQPLYGTGRQTSAAEVMGGASGTFPEMAFTIEKTSVVAQTRALKAEYSLELAQDLKAVHGLDAESELSNILSTEILSEINREVVRTVYNTATLGAQVGTQTAGTFNLDIDSNGRWSVEKFKGLMFQIEREANAIAQRTRRGRGNFILCSSDVASALAMAGVLDYAPALSTGLNVDEASTTFAGVLNGKYKVYVDPYAANQATTQFFVVGYKGPSAFDAGLFYCPYVPLQLVRAVDPGTFQPKIGFKTRYGMVANPFVDLDSSTTLGAGKNYYYRKVAVTNLM